VDTVLLGAAAGLLFGAMTVAVRFGLGRGGEPIVGSAVNAGIAAVLLLLAAVPSLVDGVSLGELWPFALIGSLVPGVSQFVFIYAVKLSGAARAAITIGTAPLVSVLLALALLDEPFRPLALVGTGLVVAGGAVLVLERARPHHFRALGVVLGLTCAVLFAGRDNAVRWGARDYDPPALQATAASLLGAAVAAGLIAALVKRRSLARSLRVAVPAFLPAGVLLSLAYLALVTGLDRGRVGIVAPLNAMQSLWAVVFAAAFFHQTEAISRRTFLAGALVVAGGAIVSALR
jgi:drug/metabolite transporter (DMT)-like permease